VNKGIRKPVKTSTISRYMPGARPRRLAVRIPPNSTFLS
jgi:hypothetical protein